MNNIKIDNNNPKVNFDIKININKVYCTYNNMNLYKIYSNNIKINVNSSFKVDDLQIYSFRKEILNVRNFSYNILTKDIFNDLVILNIYNSLTYKIYISFNKYIKKYNIKIPNKVVFDNLFNNLENSYIQKENYKKKKLTIIENKTKLESFSLNNDLKSSFIINNSNSIINICNSYLNDENVILKYLIIIFFIYLYLYLFYSIN